MRISEAYGPGKFGLSFELYPPKTEAGIQSLFDEVKVLAGFGPSYITCTYGAGGSTRDKTLGILRRILEEYRLPVAAHLTCVGATRDELRDFLTEAQQIGVQNIVALRGDPPQGQEKFVAVDGGLSYGCDLVELIHSEFKNFGIAVAGYPETHQEAVSSDADLENLKRKVDAGGDVVLTQLFYNNDDFFRFRERYDAAGIKAPLVPGILPVTNCAQIKRIASLCGAKLPQAFVDKLEACGEDKQAQFEVGVEFACRQVGELRDGKVPGMHFYVLNKSQATARVMGDVFSIS